MKCEHSHAPDARNKNKAKAIDDLKRKAKETDTLPRNIIKKVCKDMDTATAATMSTTSSLTRTINRIRSAINRQQLPKNLKELVTIQGITRRFLLIFLI